MALPNEMETRHLLRKIFRCLLTPLQFYDHEKKNEMEVEILEWFGMSAFYAKAFRYDKKI